MAAISWKWVAVHQQQVGVHARADRSDALSAAPSSFAALTVAAGRATVNGNSGLHPELQLAVQRGPWKTMRIARIVPITRGNAGIPGEQKVGARGVESALEQLRFDRVGALSPNSRTRAFPFSTRAGTTC